MSSGDPQQSASNGSSSPIQHLPYKLLVKIFLLIASTSPSCRQILRISRVCHYWREVALANTDLWNSISFHDPGRARIFLRHSQLSLIRAYLDHKRMPESAPAILNAHSHRIQSLYVSLRSEKEMSTFLTGVKEPAPRLEELLLHIGQLQEGWFDRWKEGDFLLTGHGRLVAAPLPFRGNMPLLRSLTLSGVYFSQTVEVCRNLTDLVIIDAPHALSPSCLLDILAQCPALETLVLRRLCSIETTPVRPRIDLRRLSKMKFECRRISFLASVLASLSIPMQAYISIETVWDRPGWGMFVGVLRDSTALPHLTTLHHIELEAKDSDIVLLRTYQDNDMLAAPHFQLLMEKKCPTEPMHSHGLWYSLWSAPDLSCVESLVIRDVVAQFDYYLWRNILHRLQGLRTLKLIHLNSSSLIAALEALQTSQSTPCYFDGPLCTQLANIEVIGMGDDAELLSRFTHFLQVDAGCRSSLLSLDVSEVDKSTAEEIKRIKYAAQCEVCVKE